MGRAACHDLERRRAAWPKGSPAVRGGCDLETVACSSPVGAAGSSRELVSSHGLMFGQGSFDTYAGPV